MALLRVAVAYCGGCNPRYDRVGLVRRLADRFAQTAVFTPLEETERRDAVAVVCGCPSACAPAPAADCPVFRITGDPAALERWLDTFNEKGSDSHGSCNAGSGQVRPGSR